MLHRRTHPSVVLAFLVLVLCWGSGSALTAQAGAPTTDRNTAPAGSSVEDTNELIHNGGFDDGTQGWWSYSLVPDSFQTDGGRLCGEVPGGIKNVWDAGIGQGTFPLVKGQKYTLTYEASAEPRMLARVEVQLGAEPYTNYYLDEPVFTSHSRTFTESFVARDNLDDAQFAVEIGADALGHRVCLDNVSLRIG